VISQRMDLTGQSVMAVSAGERGADTLQQVRFDLLRQIGQNLALTVLYVPWSVDSGVHLNDVYLNDVLLNYVHQHDLTGQSVTAVSAGERGADTLHQVHFDLLSQIGQNLALTVLHVPWSLDSGVHLKDVHLNDVHLNDVHQNDLTSQSVVAVSAGERGADTLRQVHFDRCPFKRCPSKRCTSKVCPSKRCPFKRCPLKGSDWAKRGGSLRWRAGRGYSSTSPFRSAAPTSTSSETTG